MTDEEKQAIERLKSIDETTEEYDGNLFKKDFNTVLNLIKNQQAELEVYKDIKELADTEIKEILNWKHEKKIEVGNRRES